MFGSVTFSIAVFLIAAIVITVAGTYLSRFADELADKTGLGEARAVSPCFLAVLLGLSAFPESELLNGPFGSRTNGDLRVNVVPLGATTTSVVSVKPRRTNCAC